MVIDKQLLLELISTAIDTFEEENKVEANSVEEIKEEQPTNKVVEETKEEVVEETTEKPIEEIEEKVEQEVEQEVAEDPVEEEDTAKARLIKLLDKLKKK